MLGLEIDQICFNNHNILPYPNKNNVYRRTEAGFQLSKQIQLQLCLLGFYGFENATSKMRILRPHVLGSRGQFGDNLNLRQLNISKLAVS